MKPGVFPEMSIKEYHAAPGLNSTLLSKFWQSADEALMPQEPKSYFSIGTAFELLVEDRAKDTNLFGEKFFFATTSGNLPDKLLGWVESAEDLTNRYFTNKDGSLSKKYKTLHGYLDECIAHPGKMPIGVNDANMLVKMVDNFFRMEVHGQPVEKILKVADFQVPIFWEWEGILKKALLDVLVIGKSMAHIFDIKTAASRMQFSQALKTRNWIQGAHYFEGAAAVFGASTPMTFLVAYKTEPYLSQPRGVDERSWEQARLEYEGLIERVVEWDHAGRPTRGWLDYEETKIWFAA